MYKISNFPSRPAPLFPMQWSSWKLAMSTMVLFTVEIIILAVHPGIVQDLNYHNFADQRNLFHVNNFWNVISNFSFLGVAFYAVYKGLIRKRLSLVKEVTPAYIAFFAGISMVAIGSAYYHHNPGNYTLVWDRLPMTIAFMALLSIAFAEFLSAATGRFILWPLLLLGIFSVVYWYYSELQGQGDLRLYAFVQMTPVLMIPFFLVTGKRKFDRTRGYWILLAFYIISKIAERFDDQIYELTYQTLGGHALKHLLVAIGLFSLIKNYELRKPLS